MLFKFDTSKNIHQIVRSGGFLFIMTVLFCLPVLAQTSTGAELMPLDERGKYIYYEVVEKNTVPADSLQIRAKEFLNAKKLDGVKSNKDQLTASGKFLISKTAFVLTRPSGEVLYNFVFEIKEGKYRFWMTDFAFIAYKRDRYANYVPATVKGIPLEREPGKLNAAEWTSYIAAASKQADLFAKDFKQYLSAGKKIVVQPKAKPSVSTKSW